MGVETSGSASATRVDGKHGGVAGNERLTSLVAAILLALLAAEGATILRIEHLVTVHVFIGMLLVPLVALKMGSTGYRFLRYYAGSLEYRLKGPPALLLRIVVAPIVLLSTLALFGTGIALVLAPRGDRLVSLHKMAFLVWFCAMSAHVLWHVWALPRTVLSDIRRRSTIGGRSTRLGLVAAGVVVGFGLAVVTILTTRWG